MIVGSLQCIYSGGTVSLFMLGRGLQGVGAAGTTLLAMALIGDIFDGQERSRMVGSLEVFNGIGEVVAPLAGATLAILVHWNQSFWVFPIISVVVLMGLRKMDNSKVIYHKVGEKSLYSIFKSKGSLLIPFYAIGGLGLFLLFGILFYLSSI